MVTLEGRAVKLWGGCMLQIGAGLPSTVALFKDQTPEVAPTAFHCPLLQPQQLPLKPGKAAATAVSCWEPVESQGGKGLGVVSLLETNIASEN